MNPLPTATEYPPPCAHPGGPVRAPTAYNRWGKNPTDCSGTWPTTLYIEDTVVIPQNIEPGEYVLGWRWYVCVVVVYIHIYLLYTPEYYIYWGLGKSPTPSFPCHSQHALCVVALLTAVTFPKPALVFIGIARRRLKSGRAAQI